MERDKALEMAVSQIERQFGKGAIMKMGDEALNRKMEVISTGALSLDLALGVGGVPRGRVVEIYGPESSGKCLTADTYVWTARGLETIGEVFERSGLAADCTSRVTEVGDHGLRVVNEHGELEQVSHLTHNGRRPVLRLELASGRRIEATSNHPLRVLAPDGLIVWREAADIEVGDVVVSALFGADGADEGDGLDQDEAVLLGYLVAEGASGPDTLGGSTGRSPEVDRELADLVAWVLGPQVLSRSGREPHLDAEPIRRELSERYGLEQAGAEERIVPYCVRTAGAKAQRAFLSALFEADGWIDATSTIGIGTASETLARQVQMLLVGFGIPCTLGSMPDPTHEGGHWVVTVDPAVAHRFVDEIGFRSERRRRQVEAAFLRSRRDPGGEDSPRLARAPHTYERVVTVEPVGEKPTFDLVLPRTHSFIANGILSHNTTLALHVVAEAQRNGGIAAFIDAEHALDPVYARALGVDIDELLISQPDTGEQALEIADMLVRSGALDVVVIDSVAALVPRAEIEGEMGDTHVGLQARLMSQALRKLTANLNRSKTTAIFINQLREKVGVVYGSPEVTPGGRALKFYASVRIDVRRIESIKEGGESIGNRVRAKVVKNKCAPPFRQAEFDIVFGEGISREGSLLDVAVDHGIVRKSGAWYTFDDDQLGQGRENAKRFLRENPGVAVQLQAKIYEQLGLTNGDTPAPEDEPEVVGEE